MRESNQTNRLRRSPAHEQSKEHAQRLKIIDAYAEWIAQLVEHGKGDEIVYASHVTLLFDHIPGDYNLKYSAMADEADRVYRVLIRHVVHDARAPSAQAKLPMWVVVPDLPTRKSKKLLLPEIRLNGGLHLNGPILIPIETRMRETLLMHLQPEAKYYNEYIRPDRPLLRIHVEPIQYTPEVMTDYAMKTLKFKVPDLDKILIFPKSLSELLNGRDGR